MRPTHPAGLGATSLGVARLRADESRRTDRLFDDPYARHFIDRVAGTEAAWATESPHGGPDFFALMADQVAVRTRFLDEALLDAVAGGCAQVVLLACGMDTRAFRLDWPTGVPVFEVDFGEVLAFKDAVLAEHGAIPSCERVEVAADLREDWPAQLSDAGLRPDRPTAWLAEGILYALPPEGADLLLDRITSMSAPGSGLAFDQGEDSEPLRAARAAISAELVDMWRGGPTGDLGDWLARRGWRPTVLDLADVAGRYHRPAPPGFSPDQAGTGRGWLVTARLG